ncbi:hypothetical protein OJF2_19800 [Aquisphaera giovannonii]|uniref:Uncharacterized protein n=1 Tax=Aquisphaera giovannonii TaxID=406548 RepID=A0A5B9VYU4_9BACT|nr:hypothetical protein [Aquisphaera giovannonii]QEH33478.1 hypothetical protein OJF2_19800 [Aquisphaera giovannonii]
MSDDTNKTSPAPAAFDFTAFPSNTLFHERRTGRDRRATGEGPQPHAASKKSTLPAAPAERRARKERRRRIDPTTFEKQYTDDEMEFMNAMQRFKERTGKSFPSYGEVIRVAVSLGYRKEVELADEILAAETYEH